MFDTRRHDSLVSLEIGGEPVDASAEYTVCLQGYHANNAEAYLAIRDVLGELADGKVVATSAQQVLEERLRDSHNVDARLEGRFEYR